MITIKVVASLNFFIQGNYCTNNLFAMCTGTKADFSQYMNHLSNSHPGSEKVDSFWNQIRNNSSEIKDFKFNFSPFM